MGDTVNVVVDDAARRGAEAHGRAEEVMVVLLIALPSECCF